MPQETYSLASLDEDVDEDRTVNTKYAPFENLLSATHLVVSLLVGLEGSGNPAPRPYGIQGGFSMQLRGGRRSTRDVDLVTSVKMKGVWDAITGEDRIIVPDSRLVEGVLKLFVKTGGSWDACVEQHRIEVDIKQAGFRHSPRNPDENLDVVGPFDHFGQALYFNVLGISAMVRIKVHCCLSREEPRDFEDVRFMATEYTSQVHETLEAGVVEEEDLLEVIQSSKMGDEGVRADLAKLLGFVG